MKIRRFFSRILIIVLVICLISLIYLRKKQSVDENSQATSNPVNTNISAGSATQLPEEADVTDLPEPADDVETEPVVVQLPEVDINDWSLTVVNKSKPLSKSFAPNVTQIEGQYFDSRAVDNLKEFISAAREQGLSVYLNIAYRTYAAQEYAFNGKASQIHWGGGTYAEAVEKAKETVAFPGTSEHQLGLAVDIVDKSRSSLDKDELKNTDTLIWMAENCAEYGFILRYPEDKVDVTGFAYEPWHFRYVGKEAAAFIVENGLCLEEFIALFN